jgi:molybdopterin converting factor small subunit
MTVKIPALLRHSLKKQALEEQRTMSEIVQDSVQKYLNQFRDYEVLPGIVRDREPLEPLEP